MTVPSQICIGPTFELHQLHNIARVYQQKQIKPNLEKERYLEFNCLGSFSGIIIQFRGSSFRSEGRDKLIKIKWLTRTLQLKLNLLKNVKVQPKYLFLLRKRIRISKNFWISQYVWNILPQIKSFDPHKLSKEFKILSQGLDIRDTSSILKVKAMRF